MEKRLYEKIVMNHKPKEHRVKNAIIAFIIGGIVGLIVFFLNLKDGAVFVSYAGMSLLGLGGAGLFLFVCILTTKGVIKITKHNAIAIKSWFIRGGKD